MELTNEMLEVMNLIEHTDQCLFITGKAGTGKTTLLKYIVNNTKKCVAVTGSTGIAAINAGGVTLHSLFGIPLSITEPTAPIRGKLSQNKWAVLKRVNAVIIDEVSMVRADIIDFIDKRLQVCRGNDKPFGGVQIIMFGDLYQLPPVVKAHEKDILEHYYDGFYFFNAMVFDKCPFRVVELSHVFRQADETFVRTLNNIRDFKIQQEDIDLLRTRYNRADSRQYDNDNIHICALRRDVSKINEEQLGEPTHLFLAEINGDFSLGSAPCDMELKLREGAKVMMLTNDPDHLYCNGSLGKVVKITNDVVSVLLDSGIVVDVGRHKWVANDYQIENNKLVTVEKGSCSQFPVTLAWAVTIHKSQGLTFDKVTIHARNIFVAGQLYVALSRCKTLEGITLDTYVSRRHIMPNNELIAFENDYKTNGMIYVHSTQKKGVVA